MNIFKKTFFRLQDKVTLHAVTVNNKEIMLSVKDIPDKIITSKTTQMEIGDLMLSTEGLRNTYITLTIYKGYSWLSILPYESIFYIFLRDCRQQHKLPETVIKSLFKANIYNNELLTTKQKHYIYYATLAYFYFFN